ncbi:unnamed protein product [Periconia digitata]|uniref:Uncharacterized protein n=1 Tax=Periconia digitata TaxID=1303443 RepID=A0A9W4XGT4_9PLEO|nr:unnamed protein product [Periconia digitata]
MRQKTDPKRKTTSQAKIFVFNLCCLIYQRLCCVSTRIHTHADLEQVTRRVDEPRLDVSLLQSFSTVSYSCIHVYVLLRLCSLTHMISSKEPWTEVEGRIEWMERRTALSPWHRKVLCRILERRKNRALEHGQSVGQAYRSVVLGTTCRRMYTLAILVFIPSALLMQETLHCFCFLFIQCLIRRIQSINIHHAIY